MFSEFLVADWNELMGAISPDGLWIAYVSDESGQFEVYRRSFPDGEGQIPVSVGGGTEPVWAPDQTAVYYRDGSKLMPVSVTQGEALAASGPEQLLELPSWALDSNGGVHTSWDVHPEGGSFVLVVGEANDGGGVGFAVAPVRVVLNWFEELRQRVGGSE